MAQQVLVWERFHEQIVQPDSKFFGVGVVIGHTHKGKFHVLHFVSTPKLNDHTSPSATWLMEHARQVSRCLPGGIDVLGFYTTANNDTTTTLMKSVCGAKWTKLKSLFKLETDNEDTETQTKKQQSGSDEEKMLVLSLENQSVTCVSFDANGKQNNVPTKLTSSPTSLVAVRASLSISLPISSLTIPFPLADFKNELHQLDHKLHNCCGFVCGAFWNPASPTNPEPCLPAKVVEEFAHAVLLLPLSDSHVTSTGIERGNVGGVCGESEGVIELLAYALPSATLESVLQSLRLDAVRSLQSRAEILDEELRLTTDSDSDDDNNNKKNKKISDPYFGAGQSAVHVLPRRVFWKISEENSLLVCDYAADGFAEEDVIERCRDIMCCSRPSIDFIHWEHMPEKAQPAKGQTTKTQAQQAQQAQPKAHTEQPSKQNKQQSACTNTMLISLSVGLMGVAVGFASLWGN